MICKKCIISGRVQGVFYRETTRRQAVATGVQGHAINLPDGRVEVLLCGSALQVEQMSQWLWEGSTFSSVSDVRCSIINGQTADGFITG